jgi:hypothetical protein
MLIESRENVVVAPMERVSGGNPDGADITGAM